MSTAGGSAVLAPPGRADGWRPLESRLEAAWMPPLPRGHGRGRGRPGPRPVRSAVQGADDGEGSRLQVRRGTRGGCLPRTHTCRPRAASSRRRPFRADVPLRALGRQAGGSDRTANPVAEVHLVARCPTGKPRPPGTRGGDDRRDGRGDDRASSPRATCRRLPTVAFVPPVRAPSQDTPKARDRPGLPDLPGPVEPAGRRTTRLRRDHQRSAGRTPLSPHPVR